MKQVLLPHHFKKIGWLLLLTGSIGTILLSVTNFEIAALTTKTFAIWSDGDNGKSRFFSLLQTNLSLTLSCLFVLIGSGLLVFSREKTEDEFVAALRLNALLWATAVNSVVLLLAILFVYGLPFISILFYNMFTVPIIFILRFYYLLYKQSKALMHEEQH